MRCVALQRLRAQTVFAVLLTRPASRNTVLQGNDSTASCVGSTGARTALSAAPSSCQLAHESPRASSPLAPTQSQAFCLHKPIRRALLYDSIRAMIRAKRATTRNKVHMAASDNNAPVHRKLQMASCVELRQARNRSDRRHVTNCAAIQRGRARRTI